MPFEYRFPRPALTVDCAIFAPSTAGLDVLLVERREDPFAGTWAAPGGFVEIDEPIGTAAERELAEETGMEGVELEEFGVFGAPGRDPRGRIVSVAHWGLTRRRHHELAAATDARRLRWFPLEELPELAFDHDDLVAEASRAIRRRAKCGGIGRGVLEPPFSLDRARELRERVLGRELVGGRFREVLVDEVGLFTAKGSSADEPSAEAEVFEFDDTVYDRLAREPLSPLFARST